MKIRMETLRVKTIKSTVQRKKKNIASYICNGTHQQKLGEIAIKVAS